MLSSIKNKTKGWVAYLIVGLITIPFALFGINEYFTGASNIVVASVDEQEISKEEFLTEFNPQKRRLQQKLAEKYNTDFDTVLKQSIINQMIDRRLLDQLAERMSHATSNSELNAIIQTNELFQDQGRFSLEKYKNLLRLNGYSASQYESIRAKELTQNQIKYNLLDSAFMLPSQLEKLQNLNDQQREFSYIKLAADDYTAKVNVDEKSVKDYYQNQKESFFAPEQAKIEFVELSLAEVAKSIDVTDDELFNFYEDDQARFTTEEERQAQHILLETKEMADEVLALLDAGGDFSKLAAQYSQDTGSKDTGGDLGMFGRGVMVDAFEKSAFALQEGQVSGAIKSEFGYHIIKLNKIQAGSVKPFESVKSELTKLYTQAQAQKNLYNLTEQLANLAYEASLEEVASQMALKVSVSEFFDRKDTKLDAKMLAAAFSDVVLNKGDNSEVLELDQDRFVVLRLKQKLPQRQKTFEEVKGEINTHLTRLLAKTFVDNIAAQIVKSSESGDDKSVSQLMDKNSLKWTTLGWVKRDTKKADISIVNKAFSLSKPKSGSVFSAQSLDRRNSVVINLTGVKVSNSKTSQDNLETVLLGFESNEVFVNILQTLRAQAEIKVFNSNL
ncbi:SurA N-terminal domain-containing protein [Candidatus Thioglobus sp.]|jgi:peptidyl-prolyl cis-trans isomerase D|uniref:SurA N-terminal domain-containing protein n=1 Tax=Candidatus Thioglobus sp. TaxID=2026721 RepID=UPI001DD00D66|nr:SurA N-terminal domain-containing protein [Candidatus Thioglobus sp.]MBT3276712.1 peptidylprolyl isomerase [Candidatus Thioglobus sp.]MBT3447282.1 peptidylprolyl isomerase [Candidatus Thioglobus sp.]MBT4553017.1 peptidylprolyl isomerase [Candidatus Thioglobus sp.]MBT5164556.1 peptidylprolyl isomerase [Candidatus Thioglobus sp.]MBT7127068.1 peptidylprolyl isomerase [Candidatus Thioglobus sp.]